MGPAEWGDTPVQWASFDLACRLRKSLGVSLMLFAACLASRHWSWDTVPFEVVGHEQMVMAAFSGLGYCRFLARRGGPADSDWRMQQHTLREPS
jgi:hypothetical protein